jgi:hypothetical protein
MLPRAVDAADTKHRSGRNYSFSTGPRLFLKYLRAVGLAPPPRVRLSPVVEAFQEWLHAHRGAAANTVAGYSRYAKAGGPQLK